MILSILIPSLYVRGGMLATLCNHLVAQMDDAIVIERYGNYIKYSTYKVEVIALCDNGGMTIGAKRNRLLEESKGKYIVFVDDDDWVYDYYIEEILKGAEQDPDSFAINGIMTTNGQNSMKWRIYQGSEYNLKDGVYHRFPNHITPVKREFAFAAGFPELDNGEDYQYALKLKELDLLKKEYTIDRPMYHYRYLTYNKSH